MEIRAIEAETFTSSDLSALADAMHALPRGPLRTFLFDCLAEWRSGQAVIVVFGPEPNVAETLNDLCLPTGPTD